MPDRTHGLVVTFVAWRKKVEAPVHGKRRTREESNGTKEKKVNKITVE